MNDYKVHQKMDFFITRFCYNFVEILIIKILYAFNLHLCKLFVTIIYKVNMATILYVNN